MSALLPLHNLSVAEQHSILLMKAMGDLATDPTQIETTLRALITMCGPPGALQTYNDWTTAKDPLKRQGLRRGYYARMVDEACHGGPIDHRKADTDLAELKAASKEGMIFERMNIRRPRPKPSLQHIFEWAARELGGVETFDGQGNQLPSAKAMSLYYRRALKSPVSWQAYREPLTDDIRALPKEERPRAMMEKLRRGYVPALNPNLGEFRALFSQRAPVKRLMRINVPPAPVWEDSQHTSGGLNNRNGPESDKTPYDVATYWPRR
jgi:hypothetical protein